MNVPNEASGGENPEQGAAGGAARHGFHRNPELVRDAFVEAYTDNPVTAKGLKDLRHKHPVVHGIVSRIFWLATEWNFRFVSVTHVPGAMNGLSDALSRGDRARFDALLREWMLGN